MDSVLKPIENAVGWLLSTLYDLPPHNLGIAIVLMTVVVMAMMLPLTAKQVRSTVAMQKLAPDIKRLQAQYKDDRQKQSEEVMKFYKENQINPLSGCLPLVVQLPVWIALYRTLREVPKHVSKTSRLFVDLCGNSKYFTTQQATAIKDATRQVTGLANSKDTVKLNAAKAALRSAKDLTHQGLCLTKPAHTLRFLGMDLRLKLTDAAKLSSSSFWTLLPYGLLVGFVVVTGVLQTRQTMARQKKQNPNQPVNPQMQTMMRIMPFMNLMTAFFPVGVALYWGARNVWMIAQQHFVLGKFYAEPASGTIEAKYVEPKSSDSPGARPRNNPNTSQKKQQRRKR